MIYLLNQATLKLGIILVKSYWTTWRLLMTFVCFVQVCVGCKEFQMCIRLMQDCMKLFSTAAKLFVWCLRLRVKKHGHPVADTECTESKICFLLQIFGDCIRYWTLRWQRHSETNSKSIWSSEQAESFFFPMFERHETCTHSFLL